MKKVNVEAISGGASNMLWGISQIGEVAGVVLVAVGLVSIPTAPRSRDIARYESMLLYVVGSAYMLFKTHQIDRYYAELEKQEHQSKHLSK